MFTPVRRAPANLDKPTEIVRRQSARLSWAWHGLCFGVAIQDAGAEGLRDLVGNVACNYQSGIIWTRDNRGNPAIKWDNTVSLDYVEWPITATHFRPSTAFTAYIRVKPGTASHTDAAALYLPYVNGQPYGTWGIQAGSTDTTTMYGSMALVGSANEYQTPTTGSMPSTEWSSVFLRWRSGETLQMDILGERGNLVYSVTRSGALSGTLWYSGNFGIRLNATALGTLNYDGTYSQALLWDRRLTDTEMSLLVSDPYGWYSPRPESVGVSSPYLLFGGQSFMREVPSG